MQLLQSVSVQAVLSATGVCTQLPVAGSHAAVLHAFATHGGGAGPTSQVPSALFVPPLTEYVFAGLQNSRPLQALLSDGQQSTVMFRGVTAPTPVRSSTLMCAIPLA